jgi:hypothetical protein
MMHTIAHKLLAGLVLTTLSVHASPLTAQAPTEGDYLYSVVLLRAAPGAFNDLIEALGEADDLREDAGDEASFRIRHSQGDHWDFMLILPMDSRAAYHAPDRVDRRAEVWESPRGLEVRSRLEAATSYREEWTATSIDQAGMARRFSGRGLFHVEMFAGLPGLREDLLEQRRMENRYYAELDRQLNVLFVREGGSNWDAMTIGFHESLSSFAAAGASIPTARQDRAARAAGFEGVDAISPYLRSLLSYHNDTLGVPLPRD